MTIDLDKKAHTPLHQDPKSVRKFQHFLIKVALVYVAISLALIYLFTIMMRNHAYVDMSEDEIHHISEMVFQSMYSEMMAGQTREGIEAAAARMSETGPGMVISVVRGPLVADLFGENEIDSMRRRNDVAIALAFKTGEYRMFQKDDRVRFLYPAKFEPKCHQCHLNSEPGEVAGVVEIIYPIQNLKVDTDYVNALMVAYFIASFIVLIAFLSWTYRHEEHWSAR